MNKHTLIDNQQKKELQQCFLAYLEAYFVQRDFAATLAFFSPTFAGFGTGADEVAYNPEDFIELYKRDFKQAPNPISYQLKKLEIQSPNETIGILFGELDLHTTIQNQTMSIYRLRMSTVFHKSENKWLMEHMHISLPTQEHAEDESYPIKEIEERASVLEKLVQERTRELEIARKELELLAETDGMTGIYNRMKLDQILLTEIQRANRYNSSFSVILFDLDNFKDINDTCGHQVGDQVLSELARIIHQRVRNTDILGRWGGDEFMIISPEINLDDATLLAETIRITLASHDFCIHMPVTSSFGVTVWKPKDTYNALIDRVDKSLYKAKRNGKNQVVA
jgi:diguanylate cyclase (GGDEF)-like protein